MDTIFVSVLTSQMLIGPVTWLLGAGLYCLIACPRTGNLRWECYVQVEPKRIGQRNFVLSRKKGPCLNLKLDLFVQSKMLVVGAGFCRSMFLQCRANLTEPNCIGLSSLPSRFSHFFFRRLLFHFLDDVFSSRISLFICLNSCAFIISTLASKHLIYTSNILTYTPKLPMPVTPSVREKWYLCGMVFFAQEWTKVQRVKIWRWRVNQRRTCLTFKLNKQLIGSIYQNSHTRKGDALLRRIYP